MAAKKKKPPIDLGNGGEWPPKEIYDNPYSNRFLLDKDEILATRRYRGRRTVFRSSSNPNYRKLKPAHRPSTKQTRKA